MVDLKISVDKSYVPAVVTSGKNRDPRELGVRVFHAYVQRLTDDEMHLCSYRLGSRHTRVSGPDFFLEQPGDVGASHRLEGDRGDRELRGGGELTFDRALITKIGPDEVAYPDETAATPQASAIPAIPAINDGPGLAGRTFYDPFIESASDKHGVDSRIVKAVFS